MILIRESKINENAELLNSIYELAERGFPDEDIAKELNIGYSFVKKLTSIHWENVMHFKEIIKEKRH